MKEWKDRFKVFVTKNFPQIYEEIVHFKDNNPDNKEAIVRDEYYVDEPYSEHWVSAVTLKPGEWFWTYKEAKKDWDRRQRLCIKSMISQCNLLEKQIEQTRKRRFSRTDVKKDDNHWWKNLPEGKQEQIERYKKIELKIKKERTAKELEAQKKKMQRLEQEMRELGA